MDGIYLLNRKETGLSKSELMIEELTYTSYEGKGTKEEPYLIKQQNNYKILGN